VTGASAGIGVELASELARRGHGVTLAARRLDRLEQLASDLSSLHGVRAECLAVDLADGDARRALPGRLSELGLEVDVLVNNAGFSTSGRIASSDEERETALVRTNVEAVVSLCSLFVPGMVERRRGAVLNVASTAAFQPIPGQGAYAASKSFVLSYTAALRAETSSFGISVTALCPGPVATEFLEVAEITHEAAGTVPKVMWETPESVAKAGIDALDRNRAVVIPGVTNRFAAIAAHHMPRRLLMPLMSSLSPNNK